MPTTCLTLPTDWTLVSAVTNRQIIAKTTAVNCNIIHFCSYRLKFVTEEEIFCASWTMLQPKQLRNLYRSTKKTRDMRLGRKKNRCLLYWNTNSRIRGEERWGTWHSNWLKTLYFRLGSVWWSLLPHDRMNRWWVRANYNSLSHPPRPPPTNSEQRST